MEWAGDPRLLHPYALISLLAAVGAVALASGIAVRDPRSPAHRRMALLMLSAGLWSLGAALWCSAGSAGAALAITRASALPAVAIAPLALHLLLALGPGLAPRYRPWLAISYGLALGLGGIWAITPWFTSGTVRTSWGWAPVFTPWVPAVSAAVVALPLAAVVSSLRLHRRGRDASGLTALHVSVVLPLGVTSITDLVLPLQGIHVPPIGPASVVAWGAALWWIAYRTRGTGLSPRDFAHEILETLATGVVLLRVDGRIRAANARLAALVGCPREELLGRSVDSLLSGCRVGDFGRQREVECELVSASGVAVPVAISQSPLRDEAGSAIGFVLAVHDLREVAALRSRLVTSGRLAAVGQLAAGIAHEINNPLAYVRSNLGLLQSHWEDLEDRAGKVGGRLAEEVAASEGSEMIGECREGVERVACIVRDVGGFAQQGPPSFETADLGELLDTAVRVATPQLRERARVERVCAGPLPRVRCVPQELMQVFLNLVLNAAQSLDAPGSIRIVTEARDGDVWVRIEDDGRGLPEGGADRVFDAFFTTKPAGEGTGLGLAISRQIVVRHGGEIGAEAREGGGSVFWLRVPIAGPA
jgi:PAS domain S-box-containing protein